MIIRLPSASVFVAIALTGLALTLGVPAAASTTAVVPTIAGGGLADGGQASASNLTWADDIALDSAANMFVADQVAQRVREIAPNVTISTYAGNGVAGLSGDGGPATSA